MIDKNELRLGNYVFDEDNDISKICSLETDNKIKYDGMDYGDDFLVEHDGEDNIYMSKVINPIPLTEEWFVKFGFEKVGSTNIYFFIPYPNSSTYGHKINVFKYEINEFGLAFSDKLTGRNRDYISATRIKHVHQLQNLYFALTGEELKLA